MPKGCSERDLAGVVGSVGAAGPHPRQAYKLHPIFQAPKKVQVPNKERELKRSKPQLKRSKSQPKRSKPWMRGKNSPA